MLTLTEALRNAGSIATIPGLLILIWTEFARKRAAGWGARPVAPMTRLGWTGVVFCALGFGLTLAGWVTVPA